MKLLFPGWSPTTEELVSMDGGAPLKAHLRIARRWLTDGQTLFAVLIDISHDKGGRRGVCTRLDAAGRAGAARHGSFRRECPDGSRTSRG
jgi:hypothetical protein